MVQNFVLQNWVTLIHDQHCLWLVTFHMVNFGVVTNNQYGNFCSLAFIGFKDGKKFVG